MIAATLSPELTTWIAKMRDLFERASAIWTDRSNTKAQRERAAEYMARIGREVTAALEGATQLEAIFAASPALTEAAGLLP